MSDPDKADDSEWSDCGDDDAEVEEEVGERAADTTKDDEDEMSLKIDLKGENLHMQTILTTTIVIINARFGL